MRTVEAVQAWSRPSLPSQSNNQAPPTSSKIASALTSALTQRLRIFPHPHTPSASVHLEFLLSSPPAESAAGQRVHVPWFLPLSIPGNPRLRPGLPSCEHTCSPQRPRPPPRPLPQRRRGIAHRATLAITNAQTLRTDKEASSLDQGPTPSPGSPSSPSILPPIRILDALPYLPHPTRRPSCRSRPPNAHSCRHPKCVMGA
ncbi:hypothetical protein C8Q73DRAFT_218284 [Cubamyces lactineus]|nr:hypothetical protein C8Q73DRAFT_218284 [Cubamyces lactineus]